MKKLLAVVLLAAAMVAPAFAAEKGSMEINGKLGVLFSPTINGEASFMGQTIDQDADLKSTVSLGADFFYYVDPQIALGFGLEYVIPSEFDEDGAGSSKAGTTNLFVQAKYDIALNNDIFNNIYPIAQVGYGINSLDIDTDEGSMDTKNGLYWGIGLGTTIKENFLVELIYAFNYGEINLEGESFTADATLKLFKLKVGYKFAI
jgi:opacity protein-like surface antigen